jgi:monoamine oxidase
VQQSRLVVEADQVIVALPPVLAARIDYTPALPRAKRRLLRRIVPGQLITWQAVYQEPFWREQGLSGQAVSDVGPANTTFDNAPPMGAPGILFGFGGGAEAEPSRSSRARPATRRYSATSPTTSGTPSAIPGPPSC